MLREEELVTIIMNLIASFTGWEFFYGSFIVLKTKIHTPSQDVLRAIHILTLSSATFHCLFVVIVVFFFLPECLPSKSSSASTNSPSEPYPSGTPSSALESRLHPYPLRPHPALIWTLLGQFSHQNFLFSSLFFLRCRSFLSSKCDIPEENHLVTIWYLHLGMNTFSRPVAFYLSPDAPEDTSVMPYRMKHLLFNNKTLNHPKKPCISFC